MKLPPMQPTTPDLPLLIMQAAEDNSCWEQVLIGLIGFTGARKGIITLRDLETAALLLPEQLSATLSAPLISGIEPEFVESYIGKFAELDPWTNIERQNHPDVPYCMSDYLSNEELIKTDFWKWLEPQGINDAVVAEIYQTPKYWVALNLHFNNGQPPTKKHILDGLNEILPNLRSAWRINEASHYVKPAANAGGAYLQCWSEPCLVINEDHVITFANTHGLNEFPRHIGCAEGIKIGDALDLTKSGQAAATRQMRCAIKGTEEILLESRVEGRKISIAVVARSIDIVGKHRLSIFLRILPQANSPQTKLCPIWEAPDLSKRQKAIIQWIAEGSDVPTFAADHGLKVSTAYAHLLAAREKLGGISARDIYSTHQAYLMQLRYC